MWIVQTNVRGITYWLQERDNSAQLSFIKDNATVYPDWEKAAHAIKFFNHKFFTILEVVAHSNKSMKAV